MSSKALLPRSLRSTTLALAWFSAPCLPLAISAQDIPATAVSLSWTPNPESNLAGYKLHFGTSSRNYSVVLDIGPGTRAPLPPMILGNTYYVAVSAYDTDGRDGPLSAELVVTASPPAPVAGTGFATGPAGQGALEWKYPAAAAGSVDRFTIQSSEDLKAWSAAGGITPAEAIRSDAQWLYFRVPFPTGKPRQFFRVGAVNPFGESE